MVLFTSLISYSQMGVGTTSPDASAQLDITATNKGVLVPRVSLSNVNLTTLDGTNPAAIGLLIWNTNAAIVGGNGAGFYFFNGTQWMPINQTSSTDHDFYEEGSTTAPDAISDDIFHMGNIAIGKNTADTTLDVYSSGTSTSNIKNTIDANTSGFSKVGFENTISGSASDIFTAQKNTITSSGNGNKFGIYNTFDAQGLIVRGVFNEFNYTQPVIATGFQIFGLENVFPINTGHANIGTKNTINTNSSNMQAGTQNTISAINSEYIFGTSNTLTGLKPIGTINGINSTSSSVIYPGIGTDNWFNPVNPNTENIGTRNAYYGAIATTNYGTKNIFTSSSSLSEYGTYNSFSPSNSTKYGLYNVFNSASTGDKYGVYNLINNTAGGTHYGIYSSVLKSGSYAGYFLGNVALGTTTSNMYILPASRGTNGQIMQTDGSGNVNWTTPTNTVDSDWYEIGTTSAPNAITDNIFTQGNVAIGKNTIDINTKVDIGNTDKTATLTLSNTYDIPSSTSDKYGILNTLNSTEYQNGVFTNLLGNAPSKIGYSVSLEGDMTNIGVGFDSRFETTGTGNQFGMYNTFASTTNSGTIWGVRNWFQSGSGYTGSIYGISNDFFNNNNGTHTAVSNSFTGTGSGIKYGVKNTFTGTSSGTFYGTYTDVSTTGAGVHYGSYTSLTGTGTNTKYGAYISISSTAGGVHYGLYSSVLKTGSYAGYFLGKVAIGTLSSNQYYFPTSRGLNGQIMQTDGSGNLTWQQPTDVFTDTDNQTIDELSLTGDTLNISLQDDGVATQTLNLSSIDNQNIDVFSLSGNVLSLSLVNDGVPTLGVDLSTIDNQFVDVFSLSGNTLNLSLNNDGAITQTLDLSTFANDWKTTGNASTVSGTNFIGTTDAQDLDFRTNDVIKLKLTQQGQLSFQNTGGSVFVGSGAGNSDDLTTNQNTFVGTNSGTLTTSGNLNTAVGHFALDANSTGIGNTAIGKASLSTNDLGSNNTALGRLSDVSSGSLTNATVIGYNATVNASNKIRLGNSSVTVIEGQVAYSFPSDARFKFNVQENVPGLDFISRLKPVTYQFDTQKFDAYIHPKSNDNADQMDYQTSMAVTHSGFLAQDVEQICKDLGYEFDGLHIPDNENPTDHYSVAYSQFIMPLVKAVQEQQAQIQNTTFKIQTYEERMQQLETENKQLKSELEQLKDLEQRIQILEKK